MCIRDRSGTVLLHVRQRFLRVIECLNVLTQLRQLEQFHVDRVVDVAIVDEQKLHDGAKYDEEGLEAQLWPQYVESGCSIH